MDGPTHAESCELKLDLVALVNELHRQRVHHRSGHSLGHAGVDWGCIRRIGFGSRGLPNDEISSHVLILAEISDTPDSKQSSRAILDQFALPTPTDHVVRPARCAHIVEQRLQATRNEHIRDDHQSRGLCRAPAGDSNVVAY